MSDSNVRMLFRILVAMSMSLLTALARRDCFTGDVSVADVLIDNQEGNDCEVDAGHYNMKSLKIRDILSQTFYVYMKENVTLHLDSTFLCENRINIMIQGSFSIKTGAAFIQNAGCTINADGGGFQYNERQKMINMGYPVPANMNAGGWCSSCDYNDAMGGSHGGQGGSKSRAAAKPYGSYAEPLHWGSPGVGSSWQGYMIGGQGGGAIKIESDATVTINGVVRANGKSGNNGYEYGTGGGGAGGSIWITGSHVLGTGTIQANGAKQALNSYYTTSRTGHGGGGGRIAMVAKLPVTESTRFTGSVPTAYSSAHTNYNNYNHNGAPGTVFENCFSIGNVRRLHVKAQASKLYTSENLMTSAVDHSAALTTIDQVYADMNTKIIMGGVTLSSAELSLSQARGTLNITGVVSIPGGELKLYQSSATSMGIQDDGTVEIQSGSSFKWSVGILELGGGSTASPFNNAAKTLSTIEFDGVVRIKTGAKVNMPFVDVIWNNNGELRDCTVDVKSFTLKSSRRINVYGQVSLVSETMVIETNSGFDGTQGGFKAGEGPGTLTSPANRMGGTHGGTGGFSGSTDRMYGAFDGPLEKGSGGYRGRHSYYGYEKPGQMGGAAIKFTVTGKFTMEENAYIDMSGSISPRTGGSPSESHRDYYMGGGGAGGSIWLDVGEFVNVGSAQILAKGGHSIHNRIYNSYQGNGKTYYPPDRDGGGGGGGRIAFVCRTPMGDVSQISKLVFSVEGGGRTAPGTAVFRKYNGGTPGQDYVNVVGSSGTLYERNCRTDGDVLTIEDSKIGGFPSHKLSLTGERNEFSRVHFGNNVNGHFVSPNANRKELVIHSFIISAGRSAYFGNNIDVTLTPRKFHDVNLVAQAGSKLTTQSEIILVNSKMEINGELLVNWVTVDGNAQSELTIGKTVSSPGMPAGVLRSPGSVWKFSQSSQLHLESKELTIGRLILEDAKVYINRQVGMNLTSSSAGSHLLPGVEHGRLKYDRYDRIGILQGPDPEKMKVYSTAFCISDYDKSNVLYVGAISCENGKYCFVVNQRFGVAAFTAAYEHEYTRFSFPQGSANGDVSGLHCDRKRGRAVGVTTGGDIFHLHVNGDDVLYEVLEVNKGTSFRGLSLVQDVEKRDYLVTMDCKGETSAWIKWHEPNKHPLSSVASSLGCINGLSLEASKQMAEQHEETIGFWFYTSSSRTCFKKSWGTGSYTINYGYTYSKVRFGGLLWEKPGYAVSSTTHYAAPVLSHDGLTLYTVHSDKSLRALSTVDGTELWKTATTNYITVENMALSHDGQYLYLQTDGRAISSSPGGRLVAVYTADGTEKWSNSMLSYDLSPVSLSPTGDIIVINSYEKGVTAYGAATGAVRWQDIQDKGSGMTSKAVFTPSGHSVCYGRMKAYAGPMFACRDKITGARKWAFYSYLADTNKCRSYTTPVMSKDLVFFIGKGECFYNSNSVGARIFATYHDNGNNKWTYTIPTQTYSDVPDSGPVGGMSLSHDEATLYVVIGDHVNAFNSLSGTIMWTSVGKMTSANAGCSTTACASKHPPYVTKDGSKLYVTAMRAIVVFSTIDGSILHTIPLASNTKMSPVVSPDEGEIYISGSNGVLSSFSTGKPLPTECNACAFDKYDLVGNTPSTVSESCWTIKSNYPTSKSGLYWIQPDLSLPPFKTFCDMTTDGGGWTLLLTLPKHVVTKNKFKSLDDWPDEFEGGVECDGSGCLSGNPKKTWMYKGSLSRFEQVREEIVSGSKKVYTECPQKVWHPLGAMSLRTTPSLVTYDKKLIAFGGRLLQGEYSNGLWSGSMDSATGSISWNEISPSGTLPAGRQFHSANMFDSTLVIYGGSTAAGKMVNELWVIDLASPTPSWLARSITNTAPSARGQFSSELFGSRLYLFGGRTSNDVVYDDMWSINSICNDNSHFIATGKCTWRTSSAYYSRESQSGMVPPARYGHTTVMHGSKMILFGGAGHVKKDTDVVSSQSLASDGWNMQFNDDSVVTFSSAFTAFTTISKSFVLPDNIVITAKIRTGASPTSGGIVIMGASGACGNLYAWIGSTKRFNFGVQCNGGGSDAALATALEAQANTDYILKFTYDGDTAAIYVDGVLQVSAKKQFYYPKSITKVAFGAGNLDDSSLEAFEFGSISNAQIGTMVPRCEQTHTWYGWSSNEKRGVLSKTLTGKGVATLNYGNCGSSGNVNLYVNDVLFDSISAESSIALSKEISIPFKNGDVLKLSDANGNSVIKMNSFTTSDFFNDLYEVDLEINREWKRLSPIGTLPPARLGHSMVLFDGKIIIFAGHNSDFLNDVWELDLSVETLVWKLQRSSAFDYDLPAKRWLYSTAVLTEKNTMIALGDNGDEGITSTGYTYKFKGECSSGKESRMFEGNGDNDGTNEEKIQRCYEACKNKKASLNNVEWNDFVAIGFIIAPSGRCSCEDAESTCPVTDNSYERYDIISPSLWEPYSFEFDGECSSGVQTRMYEGNGDNGGTEQERTDRCYEACRSRKLSLNGVDWENFMARGFIVMPTTGRCYCEDADTPCPKVNNGKYKRYDMMPRNVWKLDLNYGACMDTIRKSYTINHRESDVWWNSAEPLKCHKSYYEMITGDNAFSKCSKYLYTSVSSADRGTAIGWQMDLHASGHCWFGRGDCCGEGGGTSTCGSDPDGNYWGKVYFRETRILPHVGHPLLGETIGHWDFMLSLDDQSGTFGKVSLHNGATHVIGRGLTLKSGQKAVSPNVGVRLGISKTISSFVTMHSLTGIGGSIFSVEDTSSSAFDALVLSKVGLGGSSGNSRKWIADSDGSKRTQIVDGDEENEISKKIFITAVYEQVNGMATVALYRNGHPYGSPYSVPSQNIFSANSWHILFGPRFQDDGDLEATIHQAFLWERALNKDEVFAFYSNYLRTAAPRRRIPERGPSTKHREDILEVVAQETEIILMTEKSALLSYPSLEAFSMGQNPQIVGNLPSSFGSLNLDTIERCDDVKRSGVFKLDFSSSLPGNPSSTIDVYCDNAYDGGGWMLFLADTGTGDPYKLVPSPEISGSSASCTCNADGTIGDGSAAAKVKCEGIFYRESVDPRQGYVVRGGKRRYFPFCGTPGACAGGTEIILPGSGTSSTATNVCTETEKYYWPSNEQSDKCIQSFPQETFSAATDCAPVNNPLPTNVAMGRLELPSGLLKSVERYRIDAHCPTCSKVSLIGKSPNFIEGLSPLFDSPVAPTSSDFAAEADKYPTFVNGQQNQCNLNSKRDKSRLFLRKGANTWLIGHNSAISQNGWLQIGSEKSVICDRVFTGTAYPETYTRLWLRLKPPQHTPKRTSGTVFPMSSYTDSGSAFLIGKGGNLFVDSKRFFREGVSLHIGKNSEINGIGRGYECNRGPGLGRLEKMGGAHGGAMKGDIFPTTYGNYMAPTEQGSSGFYYQSTCHRGGSAIAILSRGVAAVHGRIDVSGHGGDTSRRYYGLGGGAAGSVWLTAEKMVGVGKIVANGGRGGNYNYQPGQGGGGAYSGRHQITIFIPISGHTRSVWGCRVAWK